jgi:hypothetical protein
MRGGVVAKTIPGDDVRLRSTKGDIAEISDKIQYYIS